MVALAELRPELGRMAAERFGIAKVYRDHRAMLEDPDVDAVVVATRRHATGPIVLDCLDAGKHVLSEKPMCHSHEQGRRLVEAADRSGSRYVVGFMKRHDAGLQQAKQRLEQILQSGALGAIVLVRGTCMGGDIGADPEAYVMTAEDRPEGLELWQTGPSWLPRDLFEEYDWFLNVNVHLVNMLRHLLGDDLSVKHADLTHRSGRAAVIEWNDVPVLLEMGEVESDDWHEGIEVFFERGRLRIAFPPPLKPGAVARVELVTARASDGEVLPSLAPSWAFQRQAEAFVRDLQENRQSIASAQDSLRDLEICEALWRAHLGVAADEPAARMEAQPLNTRTG